MGVASRGLVPSADGGRSAAAPIPPASDSAEVGGGMLRPCGLFEESLLYVLVTELQPLLRCQESLMMVTLMDLMGG